MEAVEAVQAMVGGGSRFGAESRQHLRTHGDRERLLAAAYRAASVPMVMVDPAGIIIDVNAAFCRFLGRKQTALLGTPMREVIAPEDRAADELLRSRLAAGTIDHYDIETRYLRGDGAIAWGQLAVDPARDDDGAILCSVGQVQDITGRKILEQRLAASEALLRQTFGAAGIAMHLVDPAGRIVNVNEAACRFHRRGRTDLLARSLAEITHPDDLGADLTEFRRTLAGEIDGYQMTKRYIRADGETVWGALTVSCIRDEAGAVTLFIGQVEDITTRVQAENALRVSEERFRTVVEHLPGTFYIKDGDGRYLLANEEAAALCRRPAAEVTGATDPEMFEAETAADFQLQDRKVRETGQPLQAIEEVREGDSLRWLLTTKFPIRQPGGEVLLGGFSLDVTGRENLVHAFEAANRRFTAFADNSPACMVIKDAAGAYRLANPAFRELSGIAADAPALCDADLGDPATAALSALDRQVLATGAPASGLEEIGTGENRRVLMTVKFPVAGEGGETLIGGISQDVTAERRLAHELAAQADHFRALIERFEDVVAVFDRDARRRYVSPAIERVLGYTPEEWLAGSPFGNIHPDDREAVAGRWAAVCADSGALVTAEVRIRHKNGRWVWIEFEWVSRFDDPAIGGILSTFRDVTEAVEARREIERLASQDRAILEAAAEGIALVAPDGHVLLANPAFAGCFGLTPEDFVGQSDAMLCPYVGAQDGALLSRLGDPADPAGEHAGTLDLLLPQARTLAVSSAPVITRSGEHLGRLYLTRDVTEERALQQAREDLTNFTVHELRTPLAAISGFAELLLMPRATAEDRAEFAGMILQGSRRMAGMVNQMLDLARLESGEETFAIQPVDAASVADGVVEQLYPLALAKRQSLELEIAPELPLALADPDRLGQALTNLVANAIKYTPDDGRIRLVIARQGSILRFEIRDSGIGMSPEEQDRLFSRFYRARAGADGRPHGTGLGLLITRRLIEAMGGEITVRSAPGLGSVFVFTTPVAPGG